VHGPFDGMAIATDSAGAVVWQQRYATVNQDELEGVVELANHDVLAVGREYIAGRGADAWWLRLDPATGAILSQTTFGDANDETIHGVARTTGGAVLVGEQATRALAIAIDDTGAVRWSRLLLPAGASASSLAAVTTLANGDVLAVGARDSAAWFVELDDSGAIVRERAVAGAASAAFTSVIAATAPATGWLAGGTLGRPASPYRDAWLVRADASGAIAWQKTYTAADTVLGLAAHGTGFVAAGETQFDEVGDAASAWLLAVGDTGAAQWERQYGSPVVDASGAFHGVATAADGRVIAAGHDSGWGAGSYDAWLASVDATGAIGGAVCPAYVATALASTVATSSATSTATTSAVGALASPVAAPGTATAAPLGATVGSVCYE
jgi:hypothetical protein